MVKRKKLRKKELSTAERIQRMSEEEGDRLINAYVRPSDRAGKGRTEQLQMAFRRKQRFWEVQHVAEWKMFEKYTKNIGIDVSKYGHIELNYRALMDFLHMYKAWELKHGPIEGISPEKFEQMKKKLEEALGIAGKQGVPIYH